MKLHVWTDNCSYQVCVFAPDIPKAREIALLNLGTTDDSCPNRASVIRAVTEINPNIWQYNPVCFIAIDEGEDSKVYFS